MNQKYLFIILAILVIVTGVSYYFSLIAEQNQETPEQKPEAEVPKQEPAAEGQFVIKEGEEVVEEVEQEGVVISDKVPEGKVIYIAWRIFSPKTLTIKEGTAVRWINTDINVHQIKEVSLESLFRSPRLNEGESFSYTFMVPGEYTYIDTINTYMSGKIIVEGAGLGGVTGNVIGFFPAQNNFVVLLLFIALGLILIHLTGNSRN